MMRSCQKLEKKIL